MAVSEYLQAILLGIVQGIAEFLPISSSGHLVIVQSLFQETSAFVQTSEDNLPMNVALHLGTLFSILVVYRRELLGLTRQPRTCAAIIVATAPVVVIGLGFKDQLEQIFNTPLVAGFGLLVTAAFLMWGQIMDRRRADAVPALQSLEDITLRQAIVVGCFQAVAILPGISRSGSTIAGGLIQGFPRQLAAGFSFLIAIPAISGAAVLMGKDMLEGEHASVAFPVLAIGMLTSFLVGWLSLKGLLRLINRGKLHWFAWYTFAVGGATIIWQLSK